MYIWKIVPFEVSSTDRTAAPRSIVGIEISFFAGRVSVLDTHYSPVTLIVNYFDDSGQKRDYLHDKIDADVIRTKAMRLGVEDIEGWVKATMDAIIKSVIGGATIQEHHAAMTELAGMFGQVLLPVEEQTGTIN